MKVALVHYHLKIGGVSTVLKRQIAVLHNCCDLLVMTGDSAGTQLSCPVVEIPALGYDHPQTLPFPPEQTAEEMLAAMHRKWPSGCDLMHIHNPLLAKNHRFFRIIERLRKAGIALLLHVHDFAEDGRPQAYFDEPYPQDCHYAVINKRDMKVLRAAGLKETGLHYLPNAIGGDVIGANRPPKAQILYPVRAIRRKNMGEAALLSLFFDGGQRLAVTQPPNSPIDAVSYRDWTAWIAEHDLPIELDAGKKSDFADLVAESESILTTSVAEGFGMAFLEPWTVGKPLWGRRLADVCADFEACGVRLDWLYDRLNIPLDWVDRDRFSACWHAAVSAAAQRFGHHLEEDRLWDAFDRLTADGRVDFGLLNEALQRQILSRLVVNPTARKDLSGINPWLSSPGGGSTASGAIESNREAVLRHFGPDRYRERLMKIYERVAKQPVRQHIDKMVLLDAFFDLERFSLLKWGPYEQA